VHTQREGKTQTDTQRETQRGGLISKKKLRWIHREKEGHRLIHIETHTAGWSHKPPFYFFQNHEIRVKVGRPLVSDWYIGVHTVVFL
jgi:hypothetical protein